MKSSGAWIEHRWVHHDAETSIELDVANLSLSSFSTNAATGTCAVNAGRVGRFVTWGFESVVLGAVVVVLASAEVMQRDER